MRQKNNVVTLFYKLVAATLTICLISTFLTGCSEERVIRKYKRQQNKYSIASGEVLRNDSYALSWDDDAKSIQIECLDTGKIWSNIAYETFQNGGTSVNALSSLTIKVVNSTTLISDVITSNAAYFDGGDIIAEKIKNGIRVTYYFDLQKISIPVDYILNNDSLSVFVDTQNIIEGSEEYYLAEFSPTPLLCATHNNNDDGYLFIPSGQGALMNTDVSSNGTRSWSGEVYSGDASMMRTASFSNEQSIRLPVFGAKDGQNAIFAIIESAAANSFIKAEAGNKKVGFSYVGPTFFVRGYDSFWKGSSLHGQSVITQYANNIDSFNAVIKYYFLSGDKADYNGMAATYRNYLEKNKYVKKSSIEPKAYAVTYLGGTNVNKSILGIPTTKLVPLTTFSQAKDSVQQLTKLTSLTPYVRLLNFGDGGMNPATYLGGKSIPTVYGNKSEIDNLNSLLNKNKSNLFFDFDMLFYGKSGNGIKKKSSSARTAVKYSSTEYKTSPIRVYDETTEYKALAHDLLFDNVSKVLKKTEKYKLDGLSFTSLTNSLYSDYSAKKNISKSSMEKIALNIIKEFKKSNKLIAASEANAYAAGVSDIIFEVPCDSNREIVLDATIPFYQMVYSGYVPMYCTGINTTTEYKETLSMAASSGIGVGFNFIGNYISQSVDFDTDKLYSMPAKLNLDLVKSILVDNDYINVYNKVSKATLDRYDILENGVTISTFSNGIKIYANHSSEKSDSPIGTLSAFEFKLMEAEK